MKNCCHAHSPYDQEISMRCVTEGPCYCSNIVSTEELTESMKQTAKHPFHLTKPAGTVLPTLVAQEQKFRAQLIRSVMTP